MYINTFNYHIPITRLISFEKFKQGRQATIKTYLIYLLGTTDSGLTCREISDISGIWVQSLTNPIKLLLNENKIEVIGVKKSSVSNRMVQVYAISVTAKNAK